MTIGEKIKQRRIELGMTQQELADKMGYTSRASICTIETGRESNLTTERIGAFAKALGLNPLSLYDVESQNLDLTDDEVRLIIEYRASDVTTRQMIQRILAYKGELS